MGVSKAPFRERWLLATMYWAEYRRKHAKALRRVQELENRRPLNVTEQAFKAFLLLRTMKHEDAHNLFVQVRDRVKDRSDAEGRYLTRYTQFWLAMIRWDPFNARLQCREAQAIECNPRLKRQLWVINLDYEDPLDAEFDAWVKANVPKERDLFKRSRAATRSRE